MVGRSRSPYFSIILAAALLVPFAGLALTAQYGSASTARHVAKTLDRWASGLASSMPTAVTEHRSVPPTVAEMYQGHAPTGPTASLPTPPAVDHARKRQTPTAALRGVFIPAKRVHALANRGQRPSGSPVPATEWRSAGVAMHGVGGLGVGLCDGDVLTQVGGTPATSQGAVISAVTGAVNSGARGLSGIVWRGRQRFVVTVEFPKSLRPPPRAR